MLAKTKPTNRVKFSHECELIIFTPSAIHWPGFRFGPHYRNRRRALDVDMDALSVQTVASAICTKYIRYRLGNHIRSHRDMAKITGLEEMIHSIYNLQLFEFAWVKRNSGDWTFSQLVERKRRTIKERKL